MKDGTANSQPHHCSMCKRNLDFITQPGTDSLQEKSSKARHRTVTLETPEDAIPTSSFDMRQLEEAASSIGDDSFPIITWAFDDTMSKVPDHERHRFIAAVQKNSLFLCMSPQERRLKRRRRGSTSGYLVRSLEAQSLQQFDLSSTIQEKDGNVQKKRSIKRLIQQVDMEIDSNNLDVSFVPQITEELCQSSRSDRSETLPLDNFVALRQKYA